jgi:hypothetical protein
VGEYLFSAGIVALNFGDKVLSLAVAPLDLLSFKNFVVYDVHNQLHSCSFIVFFMEYNVWLDHWKVYVW